MSILKKYYEYRMKMIKNPQQEDELARLLRSKKEEADKSKKNGDK